MTEMDAALRQLWRLRRYLGANPDAQETFAERVKEVERLIEEDRFEIERLNRELVDRPKIDLAKFEEQLARSLADARQFKATTDEQWVRWATRQVLADLIGQLKPSTTRRASEPVQV